MRIKLILLFILFGGWISAGPTDARLARIEGEISNIRENQHRIEVLLEKNSRIIYGNGKEGLITVIRLNTEHRSIAEKFAWLVITAFVMNVGSSIFMVYKVMGRKNKFERG